MVPSTRRQRLQYVECSLFYDFGDAFLHIIHFLSPARMEFRPLVEMTPDQLEPQVEMELNDERPSLTDGERTRGDATSKILQRWERVGVEVSVSYIY